MKGIILFYLFIIPTFLLSQETILPDLEGNSLLDRLRSEYKPARVLNYADAREFMFENLQVSEDTIEAIYSGYRLHLPKGVPSRSWTFDRGINTEHIYPRSKGASDGNAFSDLHHLKPARAEINSSRLNHPFREIDDSDTKKWFRRDEFTFDIPNEQIDEYSELDSTVLSSGFIVGEFEPREEVKGDIARSVFYFYTMYRDEAISADPDYFEEMKDDLCQWHLADPPSRLEIEWSEMIGTVQDDKPNPFVLDCSVALRSYCQDLKANCSNQTVATIETAEESSIKIFPNPATDLVKISLKSAHSARIGTKFLTVNLYRFPLKILILIV